MSIIEPAAGPLYINCLFVYSMLLVYTVLDILDIKLNWPRELRVYRRLYRLEHSIKHSIN